MAYIFKYHPDNVIYYNGSFLASFDNFIAENSTFPIIENEFFEYKGGVDLLLINANEHGTFESVAPDNIGEFSELIEAINKLGK